MNQPYLERATDPNQYDSPELNWEQEGFADAPVRIFLWEQLAPSLGDLSDKSVLDVGTGTAWLPWRMQQELGADNVTALEPSASQRQLAHRFNPNQPVEPTDLLTYETNHTFDVITAIMVFEHIYDLQAAFRKLKDFSHEDTELLVIMADKERFLTPREDYEIDAQPVDDDTVVIRALRRYGVLHDIVRSVDTMTGAAREHDFNLVLHEPLAPDKKLQEAVSRYRGWGDQPICHLLQFKQTAK